MDLMTQSNHLFKCWVHMWHILTEEDDADAGNPHTNDVSFESTYKMTDWRGFKSHCSVLCK